MEVPAPQPSEQPQPQDPPEPTPAPPPAEPPGVPDSEPPPNDEPNDEPEAPEGQHVARKQPGGWARKLKKLEQQNQQLLDALQRSGIQPPVPPVAPPSETPEQKTAREFREMVRREAVQELQAWKQQEQAQAQIAQFQRRAEEARTTHPDWDEAISTIDIPTGSPLGQALLTSEAGPEIMYQLATNPAELARISALPTYAAAREIGRLEAKAAGAARKTPVVAPRKPGAPAPIAPVTARGPTTTKRPEDMSYEEYSAWRRGQSRR